MHCCARYGYDDADIEARIKLEVTKRLELEIERRTAAEVAKRFEAELAKRVAAELAKREAKLRSRLQLEAARNNEALVQQRVKWEVARQPCSRLPTKQEETLRVDLEIARRLGKLPAGTLSPGMRQNLMIGLLPESMERWTCSSSRSEAEHLLRTQPVLPGYLDGEEYFNRLRHVVNYFKWQRVENKTFLELGFGMGIMTAMLRGLNARVYATEPVVPPWIPSRHGPFYEVMLEEAKRASGQGAFGPSFDVEKAAAYGRQCGQNVAGVVTLPTAAEQLEGVPNRSIDLSFSLGVLEHVARPVRAFRALARVSRIGSISCHQLDMRDHRDMSKPWEFFLLSDRVFWNMTINSAARAPIFGNRARQQEYIDVAARCGFQTVHVTRQHEPVSDAGLRYAKETLEKLRALPPRNHKYAQWPGADFDECTSNRMPQTGLFICFRYKGGRDLPPDSESPPCGVDSWSRSDFVLR